MLSGKMEEMTRDQSSQIDLIVLVVWTIGILMAVIISLFVKGRRMPTASPRGVRPSPPLISSVSRA